MHKSLSSFFLIILTVIVLMVEVTATMDTNSV